MDDFDILKAEEGAKEMEQDKKEEEDDFAYEKEKERRILESKENKMDIKKLKLFLAKWIHISDEQADTDRLKELDEIFNGDE